MKYIIISLIFLLNGCSLLQSNKITLQEITNSCASGYVERIRLADKDSSKDIRCKNEHH